MNYKIYDKVICVVDCESIELLQLFTDKESRQVKKGEVFTIYEMQENSPLLCLGEGDSPDPRLLVRCENFIPLGYWREDQINKLLNEK